jgi:hypothetical protein
MAVDVKASSEWAAELLPMPGPVGTFGFLNTLQALERLPFLEGIRQGARLCGCEPFPSEERYRTMLLNGRILAEDLKEVLHQAQGESANCVVGGLATRHDLCMAMLERPKYVGSAEELRWFVAETGVLVRFSDFVRVYRRKQFVEETRYWILRDLSARSDASQLHSWNLLADLYQPFSVASIEHWNEPESPWESLTLQALWRVYLDGVTSVKRFDSSPVQPDRHRDVLLKATGEDTDRLVDSVLIPRPDGWRRIAVRNASDERVTCRMECGSDVACPVHSTRRFSVPFVDRRIARLRNLRNGAAVRHSSTSSITHACG